MTLWTNRDITPMLLTEIDKPFNSNEYLFELKFDGIRALIFVGKNTFEIRSRNHNIINHLFPELKKIKENINKNMILDGEIILIHNNKPSFEKIQERIHLKDKKRIDYYSKTSPAIFVVFDVLYASKDLTALTLQERKKYLNQLKENEYLLKSKSYLYKGIELFQEIKKLNLEGIVAKRLDSIYQINKRSNDWIKIKNIKNKKFIIGGFEQKKKNYLSVLLGEKKDNKLYFVGKATLPNSFHEKVLKSKNIKTSPFINYNENNINFIEPIIEVEVSYLERTKNNHIRHPIIKRG